MQKTSIEWCDVTWPVTRGCSREFLLSKSGRPLLWRHEHTRAWLSEEPPAEYAWVNRETLEEIDHEPTADQLAEAFADSGGRSRKRWRRKNLWNAFDYYYDADAIQEAVTGNAHPRGNGINPKAQASTRDVEHIDARRHGLHRNGRVKQNASFSAAISGEMVSVRNKRDVWTVASEPFSEAHFAVMPTAIVEPCILAGSPSGAIVLDVFGGSGTVGVVAARTGRDSILVELNPSYARMSARRVRDDAPLFNVTEVVQSWPGSEKTDVGAMDSSATQTEHSSPARSGELTTESGGST